MLQTLTKNKEKLLIYCLLLITFLVSLRVISISPLTNDSYLHMGIGRFVIDNKMIPGQSDISYKSVEPSLEWISHSWLSDVIIYLSTFKNLNLGATILISITLIFTLLLLYKCLSVLGISFRVKILALIIATIVSAGIFKLTPFVFLPLLLLSIVYLYLDFRKHSSNKIWLLPIVFFLYANLVGGFIAIGGIFLLFILLLDGIQKIFYKSGEHYSRFFLISLISLIATLLNPYFLRIWPYCLTAVNILTSPGKSSGSLIGMLSTIDQSFIRSAPSSYFYVLFLLYIIFVAFLFFFLAIRKGKDFFKKIHNVIGLSLFLILPFMWIRFTALALFLSIPILAEELDYLFIKQRFKNLIYFSIIFFITVFSIYSLKIQQNKLVFPQNQMGLYNSLKLSENLFTTFDYTGYAYFYSYPKPVYLDAQDDFFDENDMTDFYIGNFGIDLASFEKITVKDNINTVVTSRTLGSMAEVVNSDPDWKLIYFDTNGYLFIKNSSVSINFLKTYSINSINLSSNLGVNPTQLKVAQDELEKYLNRFPNNSLALGELATVYRIEGNLNKAEATLNTIYKKDRDFTYYTEMGRIKAAKGECKSSEINYLKAVSLRGEKKFSRAVLDLAVLYAGCLNEKGLAKHYFLRYQSYLLPNSEKQKVRQLAKEFGITLDDN